MPPAKKKPATDVEELSETSDEIDARLGPIGGPAPAEAAATEAGVTEPAKPDVPDGMMIVPFRDVDVLVPIPKAKGRAAFMFRQALAVNDIDRMLAALVGDQGTFQVAALVTDDDDPFDVIVEFFDAYGKATGQGNS